jgi:hypothetical protein
MRVFTVHLTARESERLKTIAEELHAPPFALGQEAVRAFIRTYAKPRKPRTQKASRAVVPAPPPDAAVRRAGRRLRRGVGRVDEGRAA